MYARKVHSVFINYTFYEEENGFIAVPSRLFYDWKTVFGKEKFWKSKLKFTQP